MWVILVVGGGGDGAEDKGAWDRVVEDQAAVAGGGAWPASVLLRVVSRSGVVVVFFHMRTAGSHCCEQDLFLSCNCHETSGVRVGVE